MTAALVTHATPLRIEPTHPALPGHFPDNPIVPGVLLLDHVQQAAERWLNRRVTARALPQAKFVSPLGPDEDAEIQLRLSGDELRFTILRTHELIAQGTMRIALNTVRDVDAAP